MELDLRTSALDCLRVFSKEISLSLVCLELNQRISICIFLSGTYRSPLILPSLKPLSTNSVSYNSCRLHVHVYVTYLYNGVMVFEIHTPNDWWLRCEMKRLNRFRLKMNKILLFLGQVDVLIKKK